MIIAHCFLREMRKGEWYLMCETSATEDLEPPFPRPAVMFEVELGEDRTEWKTMVRDRVLAMRPDLEFVHTLMPREASRGRPPAFDLTFRPKNGAAPGGRAEKRKEGHR